MYCSASSAAASLMTESSEPSKKTIACRVASRSGWMPSSAGMSGKTAAPSGTSRSGESGITLLPKKILTTETQRHREDKMQGSETDRQIRTQLVFSVSLCLCGSKLLSPGDGRDDAQLVAVLHRGLEVVEVAD